MQQPIDSEIGLIKLKDISDIVKNLKHNKSLEILIKISIKPIYHHY